MTYGRKGIEAWAVAAAAACAAVAPAASVAGSSLGDLSGPWQLLVDDYVIASKSGLVRTYHAFEKYAGNPVLVADQPWEGTIVYIYGTVLPNEAGNGYRMWYHTMRITADDGCNILYATSSDGIHWYKPSLGIRSWNGSTANNMFFTRPHASGLTSVIHSPWDPDPARRYKLMSVYGGGYYGAWSSDGIHVTDVPNNPVVTQGSDGGQFRWDPHTQQYVGYVKNGAVVSGLSRRAVARTTTTDFQYWPAPRLIMAPDDFDDRWAPAGTLQRTHFYGLSAFAYESMYVGLLWIFRATDVDGYYIGPVFAEVVTSHDGIHWLREEGERPPILPLGPSGAWDDGQLYTAIAPVREGDTLKLYYGACNEVHGTAIKKTTCSIGLATLRKDGFASLDAGATTGTLTTKRLIGAAGPLHVNYTTAGGWLKVEVLDENGNIVPGYSQADCTALLAGGVDQIVTWGPRTELPAGITPLRLRFLLQNASLYSFHAGDLVQPLDDPAPPLGCLYTFEKNCEQAANDKLADDGRQDILFRGAVGVDEDPAKAAFGTRSVVFGCDGSSVNALELGGTSNLGTQFTLAAFIKSADNRHAPLFSSHLAGGAFRTSELLFDFDPTGAAIGGLRLVCKGIETISSPVAFADGNYHHLAVTYFDGDVRFYLDGAEIGQAFLPGGMPVSMSRNLQVGQNVNPIDDERFVGHLDDILVLGRALSDAEVLSLSTYGAQAFFGLGGIPADLDDDNDVDLADFTMLQACFNGPNQPPRCAGSVVPRPCTAAPSAPPPVPAAPIAFGEKWDAYAVGTADPNYAARWAVLAGAGRYEIQNTDPVYSSPNSLKVAKLAALGITHNLTPELQAAVPGATEVIGTSDHPLDLWYSVWMNTDGSATKLDRADIFVELSKGDVHAPAANSAVVLPVIAFGMTYGLHGASFHPRFFDGKNWLLVSSVSAGTLWNRFHVQIRGTDVLLEGQSGAGGSATMPRSYTGGFDRITVRTVSNDGQRRSFDDISLSNGAVVAPCANPPAVASITPDSGRSGEVRSGVMVAGANFAIGQTGVSLVRAGFADIVATGVNVAADGRSLVCDLDLTGAAPGAWDVVVSTPYCPAGTLAGAFTVKPPAPRGDADLDGDGDVDLGDFTVFQRCFNGPNRPPKC